MPLVQRKNTAQAATSRTATNRRAAADDDEEDERPARRAASPEFRAPKASSRTAAPADDDDEDDAPPPRRRAARDEDERPARKGRVDNEADEEDGLEDEDEDDLPRSKAVQSGWGAAKKLKKEGGQFADEFQFDKEPSLVRFMGDAPFAVYKQHWIDSGLRSTKKKSFICMGKGCPLCAIGEGATKKWAFNVAVFDGDEDAETRALICGSRLFDQIADEHENRGLESGFWALSRSGKKQTTSYKVEFVKDRDLEEDWGINPDEAMEAVEKLTPYSAKQFMPPTRSYLQEIADELTGGDD